MARGVVVTLNHIHRCEREPRLRVVRIRNQSPLEFSSSFEELMPVLQNGRVLHQNRRRWGGPLEPGSKHRFSVTGVVGVADLPSKVDIGLRQLLGNHQAAASGVEFAAQQSHLPDGRIGRARDFLQRRVVPHGRIGSFVRRRWRDAAHIGGRGNAVRHRQHGQPNGPGAAETD